MSTQRNAALALACAVALAACNDSTSNGIPDLTGVPSFAVHVSDYGQTTGVTLLDGEGALMTELFVSSATELPGISAALASDIALTSQPCDPSRLSVIGRFGSNTILQIAYEDTDDVRQFSTQLNAEDVEAEGAYQSNPQDMLCLNGDRALVSRYAPNLLPGADAIDLGDDLVLVDLVKGELLQRIALDDLRAGDIDGKPVYVRPGSIVQRGNYAIVGTSQLTLSFDGAVPGTVGIVDLRDFSVRSLSFETLANCGNVIPVVDRADAVIVSCAGSPYGDPATAGLAFVTLDRGGVATIEAEFQADADGSPMYAAPTSLGGSRVIVVAADGAYTNPDVAFLADVVTGTYESLFEGSEAGGIGSGAVRASTGLVLLPDTAVGVRLFQQESDASLTEKEPVALRSDVPARTIRALRELR